MRRYRKRQRKINSVVDDKVAISATFARHSLPRHRVILVGARDNISRHSHHAAVDVLERAGEANERVVQRHGPFHVQIVANALEQLVRIRGDDKNEIAGMMPNFFVSDTIERDALAVIGALRNVDHEIDLLGTGNSLAMLAIVLPTLALQCA